MNTVFIYALVDPRNEEVRYIGKSKVPKQRKNGHIGEAKRGLRTHRHNWIRQLLREGLKPDLLILEEVDESSWEESEIKWIAHYRQENGKELTNVADGGNAPPPYQHTEESRKRIGDFFRGRSISDEHRQRISKGKLRASHPYRGKRLSEDHKRKIAEAGTGRRHSEETKRKQSKSHKGTKNPNYRGKAVTEESRQKMSQSQKGRKHSEETKQKMREARKKFYENPENRAKQSEVMKGNSNRKNASALN